LHQFRKNIIYLALIGIGGFTVFPVISFVINSILDRQLSIEQFQANLSFGYVVDLLFSKEVHLAFYGFNPINVGFWGVTGFGVLMVLLSAFGPNEKSKFEQMEAYGSHGSSRWQTKEEIKKNYYEDPIEGWYLGSIDKDEFKLGAPAAVHAIKNSVNLNSQIIVYGPPGSNKTTGLINTNMQHIPHAYKKSKEKADIIVTDPKGEILTLSGKYLQDNNYDVKVIDFLNLSYGESVNVLAYIEDYEDILRVAKGFVSASSSAEGVTKTGDPIWENGEALLLGALIAFVKEVYPPEEQNFDMIGRIIGSPNIRDQEIAETFFQRHNVSPFANELWDKFLNLEDKVRSGVVGGLSIMMTLFSIPKVKDVTNLNTIDFRELGRKKEKPLAIFIQIPDEEKTFSPIVNAIVSMMLKTMYRTARETNSVLPNPVYMIIEEMANIGKLHGIEEMLGTMRGRRIYPMMIWQDLIQIKKMFGDSWEGLLAKCDTQIFLGGNDQFTLEYISKSLGPTTIKTQGTSSKVGGLMTSSGNSQSQNYTKRELMFPDEVKRMSNSKLIVLQRGRFPLMLNKTQYKHWNKPIADPLELHELPLLGRLYEKPIVEEVFESNPAIQEPIENNVEVAVNDSVVDINPDDESPIGELVDLETGEILASQEEFVVPDIYETEAIQDEEFDFDFEPEVITDIDIQLPSSEFDKVRSESN
jgi:type IV secretory pathway TraG/TraD family ATPase VirD4